LNNRRNTPQGIPRCGGRWGYQPWPVGGGRRLWPACALRLAGDSAYSQFCTRFVSDSTRGWHPSEFQTFMSKCDKSNTPPASQYTRRRRAPTVRSQNSYRTTRGGVARTSSVLAQMERISHAMTDRTSAAAVAKTSACGLSSGCANAALMCEVIATRPPMK